MIKFEKSCYCTSQTISEIREKAGAVLAENLVHFDPH